MNAKQANELSRKNEVTVDDVAKANARLAASAPELLKACQMMIDQSEYMRYERSDMNESVKFAQEVIKTMLE